MPSRTGLGSSTYPSTASIRCDGPAVNQMCLELTIGLMWPGRMILDGKEVSLGGFSAHQYASSEFGVSIGPFFRNLRRGQMPNRVDVIDDDETPWERMSNAALMDFPTSDRAQGVDVLLLRSRRVREAIFAHLGLEEVANVLAQLRARYSGRTFGVEDFTSAFEETGMSRGFLDDWLYEAQLSGFVFSEAIVREVAERGRERFHVSVHVRNDEDAAGAFKLVYEQRVDGLDLHWRDSDVVFVGPEEVGEGWNRIGRFEVAGGKVSVVVSNGAADGESTIYADAVRWSRLPASK